MPIYIPTKDKYKIPEPGFFSPKDIINIRNIVKLAKRTFPYNTDKEFCKAIDMYTTFSYNIAKYDIDSIVIPEANFIQELEALILQCNNLVKNDDMKFKYRKIKFDIMGSWTKGEIIVLVKK
jgi:thymidine kinase